jgi:hypothetical protein
LAAVGLAGFTVIEGDNRDFFILEPAVASVVMFIAVVALAGVLTVWLDRRLIAWWRGARWFTPIAMILLVFGGLLAPTAFARFLSSDFCFCDVPPRPAGVALIVVAAAKVTAWILRWRGMEHLRLLRAVGWGATAAVVAFGLIHLAGHVAATV